MARNSDGIAPHIPKFIGLLRQSERLLADAFLMVAERHALDPELREMCKQLAVWSSLHADGLEPLAQRYGEQSDKEPARVRRALFRRARGGGVGKLRDLHDLALLAGQSKLTWTSLKQAAVSLRDRDMEMVCSKSLAETERQLAWLQTQIKNTAPQALTVSTKKEFKGGRLMKGKRLARALGWFSLGLGIAEVAAPRRLGKLIGVPGHEWLIRAIGLREIAAGIGLLTARDDPSPLSKWMWGRVGGDALDLALLGAALKANDGLFGGKRRKRTLAAIGAVAPVVAADIVCARQLTRQAREKAARPRNEVLRLAAPTTGSPDFERGSIFFVGTATVILRYAGFTILTDPNFLHAGDHVHLGYGMTSERLTEPALDIDELPPVDFVVLSHYHGDHFDQVVERRLDKRLPIITTNHAAAKLRAKGFREARGLETWEMFTVVKGDARLRITSMPGKHGPGAVNFLLPPVMGSMLEFESVSREGAGETALRLYITGDTLMRDELKEIPRRFPDLDLALLHLGGTRILGVLVTMDARQGVEMIRLTNPMKAVPIHYNDYTVFKSPLEDFVRAVEEAGLIDRVVYLRHGETYDFESPAVRRQSPLVERAAGR
jgi:L-ascorbate metabolism protein UlaG (beta-lactamase superfamily)